MDGAAFGYFVRKLQNISKRFSNPDASDVQSLAPGEQNKNSQHLAGYFYFAPRAGFEPATNRLHLFMRYCMAWTISSPVVFLHDGARRFECIATSYSRKG